MRLPAFFDEINSNRYHSFSYNYAKINIVSTFRSQKDMLKK